jgi:hypothetical protein
MWNPADLLDVNKYIDLKKPLNLYLFIGFILMIVYSMHTDLGIVEEEE